MALTLSRDFEAPYGVAVAVAPGLRRVLAPNPGPFTFKGTGVYIVGEGSVAVIDPGPDDPVHLAALKAALGKETVRHILVTHTHRDHSPAARPLKAWSGAPIYAFGPHGMRADVPMPGEDDARTEEGGDREFVPDFALRDGEAVKGLGYTLRALHTPGHASNHLCYAWEEAGALFTGDHVMGWSTTVIVPSDGDMRAYLSSLDALLARNDAVYWPTHGGPISAPREFVRTLIAHRHAREAAILADLANSGGEGREIPALVARLYPGLAPGLASAAGQSVLAHLIKLEGDGRVTRRMGSGGRPQFYPRG